MSSTADCPVPTAGIVGMGLASIYVVSSDIRHYERAIDLRMVAALGWLL